MPVKGICDQEGSWRTSELTYGENNSLGGWISQRNVEGVAGQPPQFGFGLSNHFCFSLVAVQCFV